MKIKVPQTQSAVTKVQVQWGDHRQNHSFLSGTVKVVDVDLPKGVSEDDVRIEIVELESGGKEVSRSTLKIPTPKAPQDEAPQDEAPQDEGPQDEGPQDEGSSEPLDDYKPEQRPLFGARGRTSKK